jgi:hypothetical protein
MGERFFQGCSPTKTMKKWHATTDSAHAGAGGPEHLNWQFKVDHPNGVGRALTEMGLLRHNRLLRKA